MFANVSTHSVPERKYLRSVSCLHRAKYIILMAAVKCNVLKKMQVERFLYHGIQPIPTKLFITGKVYCIPFRCVYNLLNYSENDFIVLKLF